MNNLACTSQDAAYVGGKVEEKVREEVGATALLTYNQRCEPALVRTVCGSGRLISDIAGFQ